MPKVYVLNKGGYDYTAASSYGEIVYCTEGLLRKNDLSQMMRLLRHAFEDSQPTDFIVLTSLTSLCSLACSIFAVKHNCLNLLIFNNGRYYEYRTTFDQAEVNGNR